MKVFRFFSVFAVVIVLLIAFGRPSQAQYSWHSNKQNDKNGCLVRKLPRNRALDVFSSLPNNSVLNLRTTHIAVITRTEEEFNYQQSAFGNIGFSSWLPVDSIDIPSTYCGNPVELKADILLTKDYATTPSFLEIFRIYGDQPTFFSDYYDKNGPSLLYFGLEPLPGVSYKQILAFLQERNIPIVFHTEALGAILDFIRVGDAYAEIVTPEAANY